MSNPKRAKNTANSDYIDRLNAEFGADSAESGSEAEGSGAKSKAQEENFAALLGESLASSKKKFKVGDKVKGKILVLGQEDIFIALGQQDGVVHRRDLQNPDGTLPYKKDDVVELYVTLVRGEEIRLSRHPTDKNLADDLEDAFDMMLPVQGRIVEVCKGGVRVNLKGKLAFCPISQIDVVRVEKPEDYVGKSFEFKITQFSEGGRNIVVSRRKLLEEERELNLGTFVDEHPAGDIVTGRVTRLEKYGAFVELAPGVDGLVHISEIAWSRIGDPSEVLVLGQDVTVKVLKHEMVDGRQKIALSIKQATERDSQESGRAAQSWGDSAAGAPGSAPRAQDPWSKYQVGQVVTGKINRKEVYGFFVQIEPGITGLLHQSKTQDRGDFKTDKLKVGDPITVQIDEIKGAERRISLGLPRDPGEDDWREHQKAPAASMGTLGGAFGDKLKAAMSAQSGSSKQTSKTANPTPKKK